ncbi:SPOSA6832_03316 [Sporobolomyces salmonicolor]|uniref:SPOSA6832_03316-mRNA-1:cds n=1 Tax=Sporidiobolus salmonicolor TaxID=5005 RepID=A0A0D6ENH6_SPOSA|nr:SPOSA6832_03316 [Sporobolomyces salmonicolor]
MVKPQPTPISDDSPATAEAPCGICGSHPLPHHHDNDSYPPHATSLGDPSDHPELSSTALRQRLLHAIAPSTSTTVTPHDVGLRSSSAPNLTRSHSLGATSSSPAHLGQDDTDKMRRINAQISSVDFRNGAGSDVGGGEGVGGTGSNSPRPPLLSKKLLEPKIPVGENPTWPACLKNVAKYSWLNLLLVFVPVAWAMDFSGQSATLIFVFSFLAIVPLAALLGFATEELALRVGDAFGGLLNATFGNAVELIISILALVKGELNVVRSSMLGSILSNCLLVLGVGFPSSPLHLPSIVHPHSCRSRAASSQAEFAFTSKGTPFGRLSQTSTCSGCQVSRFIPHSGRTALTLPLAVVAIVVPTAFHTFLEWNQVQNIDATACWLPDSSYRSTADSSRFHRTTTSSNSLGALPSSSSSSTVTAYLLFQLWTHSYLYVPAHSTAQNGHLPPGLSSTAALLLQYDGPQPPTEGRVFRIPSWGSSTTGSSSVSRSVRSRSSSIVQAEGEDGRYAAPAVIAATEAQSQADSIAQGADLEKQMSNVAPLKHAEEPKLSVWFAFALLLAVTALTGVTAEFLVSSIDGLTATGNVSEEFVALILLPGTRTSRRLEGNGLPSSYSAVVGNAAEHVTAITVATKNKLDLSLAVAVGSAIQIALFVVPVLVLLGWCIGQPLDLFFDPFETLLLFLCICGVNWAIADGRTNWLEGLTLMIVYLIISLTVWYYPGLSPVA